MFNYALDKWFVSEQKQHIKIKTATISQPCMNSNIEIIKEFEQTWMEMENCLVK